VQAIDFDEFESERLSTRSIYEVKQAINSCLDSKLSLKVKQVFRDFNKKRVEPVAYRDAGFVKD
jgi:hypothetical protein